MQNLFSNLQANWVSYVWKAAGILLTLLVAQIAIKVVGKLIARAYQKRARGLITAKQRKLETVSTIMQSVSKYAIWFLAVAGVCGQLGLAATMNSMLGAVGIGGLALGFGAQSFIKDVVAGLFLVFEDQASVGDFITAGGITGTVEEITLRTMVIRGARGEVHVIPNGGLGVMTNYSRADYLALVEMPIAKEEDIERARALMLEEADAFAKAEQATPPEVIGVTALNESGLLLRLGMRQAPGVEHCAQRAAMYLRIKERFISEGIEMPQNKLFAQESAC